MTLHKEGKATIFIAIILAFLLFYAGSLLNDSLNWLEILLQLLGIFFVVIALQFFRKPTRHSVEHPTFIYAPADGKVVVIEETEETEYLRDKRIQVSIFMSPLNVHIQWFPISGLVSYFKYHPGKYLVAWHPKSSTDNERSTVCVKHDSGVEILFRQIAGALARRIITYAKQGDKAVQGEEFGFIKFGSRVDIFLPIGTKILVEKDQKVTGKQTILAELQNVK